MIQFFEAEVDQSGEVRIPKEILQALEFGTGSKLFFEVSDGGDVLLIKSSVKAKSNCESTNDVPIETL